MPYIFRYDEAVAPGAAKVLDGAPAAVVLDPAADAVRPVPLGHDDVGEDEAVAVAVLQEVASVCIKAYWFTRSHMQGSLVLDHYVWH